MWVAAAEAALAAFFWAAFIAVFFEKVHALKYLEVRCLRSDVRVA
jgi:hypothetical protein